jgi:ATP-dependent protease HslVU (ClpYQ) peptidase subunit
MTIICYRDGVMAADSLACTDSGIRTGQIKKIVRNAAGALAGMAGSAGDCASFAEWFDGNAVCRDPWESKDKDSGFCAIVVYRDGRVQMVEAHGRAYTVEAPFYARGCAGPVAMGAMAAGASAAAAAEICIRLNLYCGGPVQIERL